MPNLSITVTASITVQGRRKQLESGEAVRRISIQEVLFSYLIVILGGSGGMLPQENFEI